MKKGVVFTEEHRKKISLANKGRILSDEHRKKIGLANSKSHLGLKLSKETKDKIGKSNKGKHFGTVWNKGIKYTNEQKLKLNLSGLNKKNGIPWNKGIKYQQISCRNHWNWKGGKSLEEYTVNWTETLRKSIRERDRYTCCVCGEKQGDIAHDVHHIDYNKKNCNPENLITLCHSCHSKTNKNRDKWIEFFKGRQELNNS